MYDIIYSWNNFGGSILKVKTNTKISIEAYLLEFLNIFNYPV